MIPFAHLRTKRISVTMRELTLSEGIALCRMPGHAHEAVTTAFLRFVASGADKPRDSYITDPLLWTVEERIRLVAHYLSHVADDGPDFSIGDQRFSSYVDLVADDFQAEVAIGQVGDRPRILRPLLGVHAQLLERVCASRGDWLIGAMACRLDDAGMPDPSIELASMDEVASLAWIKGRIDSIKGLPESDFEQAYMAYISQPDLRQFFRVDFGDDGMVCLPIDVKETGIPPARFRAHSCISQTTRSLFE